jgi:serine protease AprX
MAKTRVRHRRLRWLSVLPALAILLASLVPVGSAAAQEAAGEAAKLEPALARAVAAHPEGRFNVIVTRAPAADRAKRAARKGEVEDEVRREGGRVHGSLNLIDGHLATLPGKAVLRLARDPHVQGISLNHRVKPTAAVATLAGQIAATDVLAANAPAVWAAYANQGQGVTVAVLDSGIAPNPDLPAAVFGVDAATGTLALGDKGGHGTHVAGIVAGTGQQSGGAYEGVAPAARVLMVKVTDDQGSATYASMIRGLAWVVANARAYDIKVANMSLGATPVGGYAADPLDAAVEMAWLRGVTVVVSAGNAGPGPATVTVPGNDPYVVTVGAFDDNQTAAAADDAVPDWSSRGPTPFDGLPKPDLLASGRRVVSLRVPGSFLDRLLPDRVTAANYFRLSGTSMAAPVVSGVAALVLAQNPALSPNQVKYVLKATARPLPNAAASAQGAGQVDALGAVQLAARGVSAARANAGQTPNRKTASAVWAVAKSLPPVWRNKGWYAGRSWVDGSWDQSGFRRQDGSWDDGSWDATAWANLAWEEMAWQDGAWDDGSWDDGSWDDGSWDASEWDTADTQPGVIP